MDIERQRNIVRQLLALADADTTAMADQALSLDVDRYVSDARFELEQRALLRERPVVACLRGDVANPGDCFVTSSGGVPLLVVSGDDGVLRALLNVCRHRGSPLAPDGSSHADRSIACGFHGWVYRLDGRVRARPHAHGGFDEVASSCDALVALPCTEAHGLVFVRPSGDAPIDVATTLCGAEVELDEFDFGSYRPFRTWTSTWNANWKLLVETFLETYHVPALHQRTVAKFFLPSPSLYEPFGPNLRFHSLMRTVLAQRDVPEHQWNLLDHGTVEYLIAPNTVLNYSVDHLAVYRFLPRAADVTTVEIRVYVPPGSPHDDEHFERTLALHERVSGGEDFPQQERSHAALASGRMPSVVLGRNEPAAIHFHRSLDALVG